MKGFLLALQFLTIIPVGKNLTMDRDKLPSGLVYFPLVGLFLGLILVAVNNLLWLIPLQPLLINVVLVILLIILTGGLHLDGLADTVDAFCSRKSKEQMLEIMRESHIGTMGVLSLISVILLKVSLLYSLSPSLTNASLILMCTLSRCSLVWTMSNFAYLRKQGKAKAFVEAMNWKIFLLASSITLFCALFLLQLKGIAAFIMAALFVFLLGKFIAQKIGGITGDTLGAINELTEVFVLFSVLVLTRLWI